MRRKAAAFRTGRIVAGRPFQEFPAFYGHVAARPDPVSISGNLPRADARHPQLRLDPEEYDQIVKRLQWPTPFQRGSGKDPAVMPCRFIEEQPDALVGVTRRRER